MLAQTHLDQLALLPFLFQPANKNPTWSQNRGAGGGEILPVGGGARTVSSTSSSLHQQIQVRFCARGRQHKEKPGGKGPTARVDRSSPPRPGELKAVTVQWTGEVETCLFWMPIKITIWKRPCFCSVCGEASLLCWLSQVLSLIGTRGEEGTPPPYEWTSQGATARGLGDQVTPPAAALRRPSNPELVMDAWARFPFWAVSWPVMAQCVRTGYAGSPLSRSFMVSQSIYHLTHPSIGSSVSHPAGQSVSHARKQPTPYRRVALFSILFLWNPFHRRSVLTESILCREADFVIHSLPCPAFASSAWIYLVDVLQVLAKRAVPRADLVLL